MKRYNQNVDRFLVKSSHGKWVRYDDVLQLMNKQGCNCEEMSERVKCAYADGSNASWICPSHGYKRF